jgi:hypothetical protein
MAAALVGALAFGGMLGMAGTTPAAGAATDPCGLITDTDLSGLSTSYTLSNSDDLSAKNCLYSLQGDGESTTVNLFVDKPSDFSMEKALVKKAKKAAGLPSGYVGAIPGGDTQVGFKQGSVAIRMTSHDLTPADMVVVAKAVKKHL